MDLRDRRNGLLVGNGSRLRNDFCMVGAHHGHLIWGGMAHGSIYTPLGVHGEYLLACNASFLRHKRHTIYVLVNIKVQMLYAHFRWWPWGNKMTLFYSNVTKET